LLTELANWPNREKRVAIFSRVAENHSSSRKKKVTLGGNRPGKSAGREDGGKKKEIHSRGRGPACGEIRGKTKRVRRGESSLGDKTVLLEKRGEADFRGQGTWECLRETSGRREEEVEKGRKSCDLSRRNP